MRLVRRGHCFWPLTPARDSILLYATAIGSLDRLGLLEHAKHEIGDVGARNKKASPEVLSVRSPVVTDQRSNVAVVSPSNLKPLSRRTSSMSAGSCFNRFGRSGEGIVPIGAAPTTTTRRTRVACIAPTMASVAREAILASLIERGPRQESGFS